jgi:hypothetical protein
MDRFEPLIGTLGFFGLGVAVAFVYSMISRFIFRSEIDNKYYYVYAGIAGVCSKYILVMMLQQAGIPTEETPAVQPESDPTGISTRDWTQPLTPHELIHTRQKTELYAGLSVEAVINKMGEPDQINPTWEFINGDQYYPGDDLNTGWWQLTYERPEERAPDCLVQINFVEGIASKDESWWECPEVRRTRW